MTTRLTLAALAAALFLSAGIAPAVDTIDIGPYTASGQFGDVSISPDGRHLAATVVHEDRTGITILERESRKVIGSRSLGRDTHVMGIRWVSDDRLVFSLAQAFGSADQPVLTGELFSMDVETARDRLLVGFRKRGDLQLSSRVDQSVSASLIDDLPEDDDHVLIAVAPFSADPVTRVELLNVRTGHRRTVGRAPVRNAGFLTDHAHRVRFAMGVGEGNFSRLYHRADDEADWTLINDEAKSGRAERPIGFSADNRIAWLQVEHESGPDSIDAYDVASGERKQVLRHGIVDPAALLYSGGAESVPVGAQFSGAGFEYGFLDPASESSKLYQMLMAAFPRQAPFITSTTTDGRLAVVHVHGVHNAGEYYLFDTESKSATFLLKRRDSMPQDLGEVRAVQVKARDGMTLHGYLTLPPGSDGRGLPMVLHPHGGPFGVHDELGFDPHVQMLAKAGYAVLQVNHRGSSGYGRQYYRAGAREWGRKLQDDLTDATRWAVAEGVADPERICIYGASYGAYASLRGVATQPGLYRCAVGYVGVYDMETMVRESDTGSESRATWLAQWVGTAADVSALSTTKLADRIEVPVFLAAGGEDAIAPIEHSRRMEAALRKAGVPVETLYYDTEGHGFYSVGHRLEFNTRLLDFFSRHLGGAQASPSALESKD